MNHYTNNNILLKKKFPGLYSAVDGSEDDAIEAVESKNGGHVPCINTDGKKLFIHSRFDPVKEAERFIGELDPSQHDLLLVFGFGFAFHLEELIRRMSKDALLLVVEKNPAMIKRAMQYRDLTALFGDDRVLILADPDEDDITALLKGKSSRKCTFITHRGSYQSDPEYYTNILGIAKAYLSTKDVNIATLAKFERIWSANLSRNIIQFITTPGVNIFYDEFNKKPAIVAAAGPTLNRSIDFIKKHKDKAFIIAVDTSYKVLLDNGIEPHFCIVVDPQPINARYFEGTAGTGTILVADPTVHPSVFRYFRGPVVTTGIAFDLMNWIERESGEKGEITHGGSVSTNAYDFARRMGASPIILAGQDLAFTDGRAHARGSYLDELVRLRTDRFYTVEGFNRFQLTALPKVFVRGIRNRQVHTNQKMLVFLSWFEKQHDKDLINATYDGASIPGVAHVSMDDIELSESPGDIPASIKKLYRSALERGSGTEVRARLMGRIDKMLSELESLLPVLSRAVGFADNLLSLMKKGKRDQNKLDYILKKLSETDKIIESKKNTKDIISFTIQKVVHTITEGYEIDEDDSKLSDDELVAKRSHYIYQGILDGALFTRKTLRKMADILQEY